ncbi:MAG TPA: hypothetical protein VGB15_23425 [Longimicrobium sp.]|jgi:hypothetical protein
MTRRLAVIALPLLMFRGAAAQTPTPPRVTAPAAALQRAWLESQREQVERYSAGMDSVLALAGARQLEESRFRAADREVRITTGGSMLYEPQYVLRVWVRNGVAGGEWFETWGRPAGAAYAGGPFRMEKGGVVERGCRAPRVTPRTWICRLTPLVPVNWAAVVARLDSLGAWTLPPQPREGFLHATDQGYVLVWSRVGQVRNAAYYYGPRRQTQPESRAAEEIGRLLVAVIGGGYRVAPDSLVRFRPVAEGRLSIPTPVFMWVTNAREWKRLRQRYPAAAVTPRAEDAHVVDFTREQLLVVGGGTDKECSDPESFRFRVEARGRIHFLVVSERRRKWPPVTPCHSNPAPVQVIAVPRRAGWQSIAVGAALVPIRERRPPGFLP